MLMKPTFAPHFRVQVVPPETVVLVSEIQELALQGELYAQLAPWIDGTRTIDEIVDAMSAHGTAKEIQEALGILREHGYVIDAPSVPTREAAFWSSCGIDAERLRDRLALTRVTIRALDALPEQPLIASLRALGVQIASDNEPTKVDLEILVTDDYLHPALAHINRSSLDRGVPWLAIKPLGRRPWIGPLFVPGRTACCGVCASACASTDRSRSAFNNAPAPSGFPRRRAVSPRRPWSSSRAMPP